VFFGLLLLNFYLDVSDLSWNYPVRVLLKSGLELYSEETNKKSLENTVQRMGKEAVQWGLVAGVYTGMTYGMQEARGVQDWVCLIFYGHDIK
jgi:hypothetical protein